MTFTSHENLSTMDNTRLISSLLIRTPIITLLLAITLSGCGSGGSDVNLDGDLRYTVHISERGMELYHTTTLWDGENITQDGDTTYLPIQNASFRSRDGKIVGSTSSFDIPDGNYQGVRIVARVHKADFKTDIRLRLMNEKETIYKTVRQPDSTNEKYRFYSVQEGYIPDQNE